MPFPGFSLYYTQRLGATRSGTLIDDLFVLRQRSDPRPATS
jgi:hypothetical protein